MVIVKGGVLIDGTGRDPIVNPTVLIEDGRIVQVAAGNATDWSAIAGARVLDLSGYTLLPGLIDAHVHLALCAGPDHPSTAGRFQLDAREGTLGSLAARNAMDYLRAGVTTVRDCGDTGGVVTRLRDKINAGELPGPRILASGSPITTATGHFHFGGLVSAGREQLRDSVRLLVDQGADFIKVMASGGVMTPGSDKWTPQYSVDELSAIADEAHRLGKTVITHALCLEAVENSVRAGIDGIEHCGLESLKGRCRDADSILDMMVEKRTVVGCVIPGFIRRAFDRDGLLGTHEADSLVSSVARVFQRGIDVLVGTDTGVRFTPFTQDLIGSLRVLKVCLGLSNDQIVRLMTQESARLLGIAGCTGTVEAGKDADLIAVEGNPLTDIDALARVVCVIKSGEVV